MRPVLFSIGDLQIRSSPFFLVLGIIVGVYVGWREAQRIGIPKRDFHLFWISVVPLALLFGALNSLIFRVGFLNTFTDLGHALSKGLVSFGAILAILGWGYVFIVLFKPKHPAGQILDVIALEIPVVLGIYRIGCLLNGCCYGLETNSAFGMYLPGQAGLWASRYPTQIYLMIFNLGLFFWLWTRRKKIDHYGYLTLEFLAIYSAGRLLIDNLRDLDRVAGPFSLHQLTAITILIIVAYIYGELWLARKSKKGENG